MADAWDRQGAPVAALGFTFVGVLGAAFPFELPWLPLLAPPAVFVAYVLAIRPFWAISRSRTDTAS